jgi:uncharacterized membrane protein required for colicin V production
MNFFNLFGIVDVIIVLSVILFAVIGWKKGFLLKIVEMASSVFGLIASIILARPFATVLDKWIGNSVGERIDNYLLSRGSDFTVSLTEPHIREALNNMQLPKFMVEWIANSLDYNTITTSIIETLSPILKSFALIVIAFITLFFGSMIIFFFLKILSKMVTSIPFVKQVDKVLGLLFGLIKIAAIVYILLFILALLITIPGINDLIGSFLNQDMQLGNDTFRLSKWLYDNNFLKNFINVFVAIIL